MFGKIREKFRLGYSKYGVIGGVVSVLAYSIGFIIGFTKAAIGLAVEHYREPNRQ